MLPSSTQSTIAKETWYLYILPQYHGNLTQPIKYKKSHICANYNVYARFEDFRTFLYVFMSKVRFFVC